MTGITLRIVSALLVFAFTATSVPVFDHHCERSEAISLRGGFALSKRDCFAPQEAGLAMTKLASHSAFSKHKEALAAKAGKAAAPKAVDEPSEAEINDGLRAIGQLDPARPELASKFTKEVIAGIGKRNFVWYAVKLVKRHVEARPEKQEDWYHKHPRFMAEMIVLRALGNELRFTNDASRVAALFDPATIEREITDQEELFAMSIGKQTPETDAIRRELGKVLDTIRGLEGKLNRELGLLDSDKQSLYHEEAQTLANSFGPASDPIAAYYNALNQLRRRDFEELAELKRQAAVMGSKLRGGEPVASLIKPKRRGGFALREHLVAATVVALLVVAAGVRVVHDIRKEMGRRAYITQTRIILGLDKAEKGKEITISMLIECLKKKSGYDWIPATLALIDKGEEAIPHLLAALEREEGNKAFQSHISYILRNIAAKKAAGSRSGGFAGYKLLLLIVGITAIALLVNPSYALGMAAVASPKGVAIPTLLDNLHAAIRSDKPDDIAHAVWPLLDASRRRETASRAIVAVPILVNLISRKKSTAGVRRYVIYAIGKMCEKNIVNDPALALALTDALLDEVPEVREAAAEALGKVYIDDKHKARAIQTLVYVSSPDNEKYWRVRLKAVEALGKIKDPAEGLVQLALEKAFGGDPQGTVRKKAGNAIAALAGVFEAGRIAAVAP